ncbi:MAG: methyltransferase FkbM [Geobacteraceae bacterium]|nr:MAG: methyltransferase FkbM [Geobacteraceae bacterium]
MNIFSPSGTLAEKSSELISAGGELAIMQQFISADSVVFDVGAHTGAWTSELLDIHPDVTVHLFEPAPQNYHALLRNLAEPVGKGKLRPNTCALAGREEIRLFHYYEDAPSWSTLHRRMTVEKEQNLKKPAAYPVFTTTLDNYCRSTNITHINFLKIDVEGGELEVLSGAKELLKKGRIDFLQFEYGGTFVDAGTTLERVFDHLQGFRYSLFKITACGLEYVPRFMPQHENFSYSNFLAVNERFLSNVLGKAPKMLDLQELCRQHGINPRGVIHIGAHEGGELPKYRAMGIQRVLFIEANPAVFARLEENVGGKSGVDLVNCAISDHDGTAVLHVTSMDQSSSLLPLKKHKDIYPDIAETGQIIVSARRLDSLLQELELAPADFNLLNIDIQGAELLAFKGSTTTLPFIEGINTEVNFAELYSGCAVIDQLDDFLEARGFERKATVTPYHPSWGDAFYTKKPVITISCLGSFGRFANQIFQYAFAKTYARDHGLRVETPPWLGQCLFGHNDPPISRQLPEMEDLCNVLSQAKIPNQTETCKNVDFRGFFQYHTRYYAPHKEYFRSLFKPVPEIEARLQEGVKRLRSRGKTVVGLHLRRGDYGYDIFYIAPSEWYREWLRGFWDTLDQPVLYIASDEPDKVLADFAEYNPVTARDLDVSISEAPYFTDFYIMSQCDAVAISNSSFSFAACMLNERASYFFRPHLQTKKLIPFDPWNSEVVYRDAVVTMDNPSETAVPKAPEPDSPAPSPTSQPTHCDVAVDILPSGPPLCLFINTYYQGFLNTVYTRNPHLQECPYTQQKTLLEGECFGDSDFYSQGLRQAGWKAEDIIVNCLPLQQAWAAENLFNGEWLAIAVEQIRRARPDVVYIQDMGIGTREFLSAIRPHTRLIIGQIASPPQPQTDFTMFDIVFSSFPHFVRKFREYGIASYYQPLAFEPRVLERIGEKERIYPVTFVGGISAMHGKGKELLERVAELAPVEFWGYGAGTLPEGSPLRSRHHGEAWGLEMFSLLRQSRITINRHIDVAENYANNMRLFEATGCGALLITDYKDNLNELFEIGKEVVVYRSAEECAALVAYYLAHPEEAEEIARAGQARTLRDHSYTKNMALTAEILQRHLRYRQGKERFTMPARISDGYQQIDQAEITPALTSAWQDASIPAQQRALVQHQLTEMYQGKVALVFQLLADIIRPHAASGRSVLEIGCASGYYYEILEYLLNKRLDYAGVDYSDAMIAMAKDYYPTAKFFVADGATLPFTDRKFDIVISSCVLLHVPNYRQHVSETCRVAAHHVVAHRTPVCRKRPTQYLKKCAYGVETVELVFNEEELVQEFARNGFILINKIEYFTEAVQDCYELTYLFGSQYV